MPISKFEPGRKIGSWVCIALGLEDVNFKNGITETCDTATLRCVCGKEETRVVPPVRVAGIVPTWPTYDGEWELKGELDCGCGGSVKEEPMTRRGRPPMEWSKRRTTVQWSLGIETVVKVEEVAKNENIPISRAAEKLILRGLQ